MNKIALYLIYGNIIVWSTLGLGSIGASIYINHKNNQNQIDVQKLDLQVEDLEKSYDKFFLTRLTSTIKSVMEKEQKRTAKEFYRGFLNNELRDDNLQISLNSRFKNLALNGNRKVFLLYGNETFKSKSDANIFNSHFGTVMQELLGGKVNHIGIFNDMSLNDCWNDNECRNQYRHKYQDTCDYLIIVTKYQEDSFKLGLVQTNSFLTVQSKVDKSYVGIDFNSKTDQLYRGLVFRNISIFGVQKIKASSIFLENPIDFFLDLSKNNNLFKFE